MLDELDDKEEFEDRFDEYLKDLTLKFNLKYYIQHEYKFFKVFVKDELDKYKRSSGTTIEDKVKTILECFKENASHFDEDNLAEAKQKVIYRTLWSETKVVKIL